MPAPPSSPVDRPGGRSYHWRFPCDPASAGASRRAIDSLEEEDLQAALLDDVRLLVSELVTNSIKYGPQLDGCPIRLRMRVSPQAVRAEVLDPGHGFGPVPMPTLEGDSGRGLFMVNRVADRWGMAGEPGTLVWFEILR